MSIYDTLNERQKEAVYETEGPVLLLAGAGSGKTRVLTHRIAYLIENNGVNPWNILAITFTNKAAGEMRERVNSLIGFGAEQIWVSTFHSACVRILRRHIDLLGYSTNFSIYDTDDQKSLMKEVCKRLEIDTKVYKERSILSAISSAKDELIGPKEFYQNTIGDYSKQKIAVAYEEYQKALKNNNALDFDDIIVKTIELFKAYPEVLLNYQERFRYIMVDEYQDTNTAQFELIHLLAGKYRNLCVVGDDDQSIYKFRGANIHNILDFEKVFPEAKVIKLEQNYRSTKKILEAANCVIRNNTARKEKALWTENEEGERIHFRQFDTAYEEAEYVVSDIIKAKRNNEAEYGQNAVLYRTNAQSRLLEEQFVKAGVPYDVIGSINFYARKEIKDILAYLKTIDNAVDDLSVKRIINIPKRGIGNTTISKVQAFADANMMSFYDALEIAEHIPSIGKSALKLEPFVTMIRAFRGKKEFYSLEELVKDVLDSTGYIKDLQESGEEDAEERIENIHELISKVVIYEETAEEPTLSGFLEEVALVADIDRMEDNPDRVLLLTLHAAKGLEFDRVYLAGVEDGLFPSYMAITDTDPTAIEEERRLAYVGITRAKKILTISCARARMLRGEMQYNPVSRFVREIDEALMDNRPLSGRPRDFDFYEEDSPQKLSFKSKPFSTEGVSSLSAGLGATRPVNAVYAKPKAIVRPKKTELENQPFITKGVGALQKGAAAGEPLLYGVGDRVSHIKYGLGTVTAIEKGPRDYQVTVQFDSAGQKVMYAAFAKLKKVD
ncbi:MAG: UvrD-helicase domain-containing protein [Lachnospiraceae bacterium]|nr:UvrD-helicase domain-containing protein [Lachnospiraceae bacterium]